MPFRRQNIGKVLQFLSFFGHQGGERGVLPKSICTMTNEVNPMKITNQEKIQYVRGIVGNSEEYW